MGYLQNTWIKYADRTYQQIKDSVLTEQQYRVPEMTDHTSSNIFIKMLDIWGGIAEMLGYYIDNEGREAHLDVARLYRSGISHARAADYRVRGKLAANGNVVFTLSEALNVDFNITAGTLVKVQGDEVKYSTVGNLVITAGNLSGTVGIKQYVSSAEINLGNSTGIAQQEIVVGTDVMDSTTEIKVNGVIWTRVETLAFSLPDSLHYQENINKKYEHILIFGDGINGKIPVAGHSIVVKYKITIGELGDTEANSINTIETAFVLPAGVTLSVNNPANIVGGSDVENLEQLKARIPKSIRTKDRAVTEQDHIDIAELAAGVAKAGLAFKCGKTIDIYIVPDGGGLASAPLIADVQAWFYLRKMVATNPVVKPAGELHIKLKIAITAFPQFRNVDVYNTVMANLLNFISYRYQDIKGELQLGDIYQQVENSEGVKNSRIDLMTAVPYARPLENNVQQLNWSRNVKQLSAMPTNWRITFVSATNFQVLRNNGYMGEFQVGNLVNFAELDLTINQQYAQGDVWEFYTYPYFGTVVLQEPSIPVAYSNEIELIVTGGL